MLCELLRRRQASGALIPQEDHHRCELRELQIKLGLRELQHHELLCEIRDLRRCHRRIEDADKFRAREP